MPKRLSRICTIIYIKRAKVKCKTKRYRSGSQRIITLALQKRHWDGVVVPGDPAAGRALKSVAKELHV